MEKLEKELADSGIRMLGVMEGKENLVLEILKTKNERYLKQIPFLLYKYDSDINEILKKTKEKDILNEIIGIANEIFIKNGIAKRLQNPGNHKGTNMFDYNEFESEFLSQIKSPDFLIDKGKAAGERHLQYSLSMIFTRKEKETIEKILSRDALTKTEYEYYIRKTKKKLEAITNLGDFARNVIVITPKKA